MKGIILAGGSGTRLYPLTRVLSKQILPVYDKPMIYYPLSSLLMAGIREIIIISTNKDIATFQELLGYGDNLGVRFEYAIQNEPRGIAEAFIIAEKFINGDECALILGDNIFYGTGLRHIFESASKVNSGAIIFAHYSENPYAFGVVEFDDSKNVISIEEKPKNPKSNYIVPGFYFYDKNISEISKNITPSARGELEITSVNNEYLKRQALKVEVLGRGFAWFDAGTYDGLMQASTYIDVVQKRQGMYIACIEEIVWRKGFISTDKLLKIAEALKNTDYGKYLSKLPTIK